jgi:hypothetical protein
LDGCHENRRRDPSVMTNNNRARFALTGIGRRELGGNHRVNPVSDNPAQT